MASNPFPEVHAHAVAPLASVLLAGVLLLAPAAPSGTQEPALPLEDEPVMELERHERAQGQHVHGPGMQRPHFPSGEGSVPTQQEAAELDYAPMLRIIGDDQATPAEGVRSGNGSHDNPFVIEGWHVGGDLYIQDTDACYVVRGNWVDGQLTLNWNAQCVHVHHNHIRDLRVNENIRRDGLATGGLIEHNEIEIVGQLRHYDGEFRFNTVGPADEGSLFDPVLDAFGSGRPDDTRVANIDGFNQGWIHNNTFHGSVDLDFHGHHHGTGFFAPHSHYHGDNESRAMPHDHADRWTSVVFEHNIVVDQYGYGLLYEDRNHAGDDRTANSESTEDLELEHTHHTDVRIRANRIQHGGIVVDVFMADDERHRDYQEGWLTLEGNQVDLREPVHRCGWLTGCAVGPAIEPPPLAAVHVRSVADAAVRLVGNQVSYTPDSQRDYREAIAIQIQRVGNSTVHVEDTNATGFDYGLWARSFEADTYWTEVANEWGDARWPVWYDESVKNRPGEGRP